MAATITVEDGSGVIGANSYVTLAQSETFFEAHPLSSGWDALTDDVKTRYLITAARTLDAAFNFNGFKAESDQGLQWPRIEARNPDEGTYYRAGGMSAGGYYPEDEIPPAIKDAQCELARMLIAENRLDDAPGTGIREFELPGSIRVAFESGKLREIIPDFIINMMAKFGSVRGRHSGCVRLTRS